MNKKHILILCSLLSTLYTQPQVKTTLVSTTEQNVNASNFKSVMTSEPFEEAFYINDIPVLEDEYYNKLDEAEQIEREQKRQKERDQRRAKLEFTINSQNKITAKLIYKVIEQIETTLPKLKHPALTQYLQFASENIPSQHELDELVAIINYVKRETQKLIGSYDTKRLTFYYTKLSEYPEKLELLFRSSVNEAIEKCDNTANLKELLELIADE